MNNLPIESKSDDYPYYYKQYKFNIKNIKPLLNKFEKNELIVNTKSLNKIHTTLNIPLLNLQDLNKYNNHYFIIMENWLRHYELNKLSDVFTEPVRVKCKFKNNMSAFEFWNKNKLKIKNESKQTYGNQNIVSLQETIYKHIHLCNNFKISVCLSILKFFNVKKWLDISAGWGDRLISAILYGVEKYYSTDPNLDLHPYYNKIINKLVGKNNSKFIINKEGFEMLTPAKEYYDLVFSSPPFFDIEIYSKSKDDSYINYNNEDDWINNFFIPSLIISSESLMFNGHLVLYMGGSKKVMDVMHNTLTNKLKLKYEGIIYFYSGILRKMFVWKKILL